MKPPRMFRPLLAFGMVVIVVALFSFLTVPAWRNSPVALVLLVAAIIVGAMAVARDFTALTREFRAYEEQEKGKKDHPG